MAEAKPNIFGQTNEVLELEPNEITVGPRFRKVFPDIEKLADSIAAHGQMQPIGVEKTDKGYNLVFGHRRLLACQKLGVPVRAVLVKTANDIDAQLKEFLENSSREDFSPTEKAAAVRRIHEALMEKHKHREKPWTIERTAKALGLTRQYVSDLLRISKALETTDLSDDQKKRLTMAQLRSITSTKERASTLAKSVIKAESKKLKGKVDFQFLNGDCFKYKDLGVPENSFHIMLTDPPYGLDYKGKDAQTAAANFDDSITNVSEDFIRSFWKLADSLIVKNNGIVICFCSLEQFFLHSIIAKENNFPEVYSKPIIWLKASAGQPWNNKHFPVSCYETAIFARRSKEPLFILGHADWVSAPRPTKNRIHPTEKPINLGKMLLRMAAFPHYNFIDPFAGSGNFCLAAYQQGLPMVYGIELNTQTYHKAKQRMAEILGLPSNPNVNSVDTEKSRKESQNAKK